jgi:hypothetical protein
VTKVYLAKRGEGMPVGWYADKDGLTEVERKEGEDKKLERACVSFSSLSLLSLSSSSSLLFSLPN